MKSFIPVLVFGAVLGVQLSQTLVVTKEQQKEYQKYHEECQKDYKIPEEMFQATKKGVWADDATFKAHLFCMSKKSGFQNDAGEFQKSVMVEKFVDFYKDKAVVEKIIEKCALPAPTPEEAAYNFSKCNSENAPEKLEVE